MSDRKFIKAIIWDWNGTLLDDLDICVKGINIYLEERTLKTMDKDRYRDIFGFPIGDYYAKIGFDLKKESLEDLSVKFLKTYFENFDQTKLNQGVYDILKKFQNTGYQQYILSAMDQVSLDKSVKKFGIEKYFKAIKGAEDTLAKGKINPMPNPPISSRGLALCTSLAQVCSASASSEPWTRLFISSPPPLILIENSAFRWYRHSSPPLPGTGALSSRIQGVINAVMNKSYCVSQVKWLLEFPYLEIASLDFAPGELLQRLVHDGAFDGHIGLVIKDVDLADLITGNAGLAGQGAQYIPGAYFVFAPPRDT